MKVGDRVIRTHVYAPYDSITPQGSVGEVTNKVLSGGDFWYVMVKWDNSDPRIGNRSYWTHDGTIEVLKGRVKREKSGFGKFISATGG